MRSALRRLLLLLALALAAAPANAQTQAQTQAQNLTLAAGATRSSLPFVLPDIGEGRLALQFELPLVLAEARLVDPAGQLHVLRPGAELLLIDAAQRPQPARGHLLVLKQPLLNPVPGRWRLDVDHAAARGRETLLLVAQVFPRFELQLSLVGSDPMSGRLPRVGAGSEQLLSLRASDQGQAMAVQAQASVGPAQGGAREPLAFWQQNPAGYDLPLQVNPGQAFAIWSPTRPGPHAVQVQLSVTGRDGRPQTLQRELAVTVAAQPVWQQLAVAQPPGPQGCVPEVNLAADWPADKPGRYVLTLVLQGAGRSLERRVGVTADKPGPLSLRLQLPARDLLPLGEAPTVRRADLLHLTDAGFELLQRRRGLPLSEPLASGRLCR